MSQKIKSLDQDNVKFLCGLIRNIASIDEKIDDLNIRTDAVFSSKKVTELAQEVKHSLEQYIQSSINGLTHLKKKIVDTLPSDADAEENILYLVKDTSVVDDVVYNQYLLIDGVLEPLGNTSTDMSNYYNKDESDAKFALLSNLQTLIDMVGNASDLETTAKNTLVNAINEIKEGLDNIDIDNCVTKDSIVTTLDSTVTNEQIPSALATYNATKDKNMKTYTSARQLGLSLPCTTGELFLAMPDNSIIIHTVDTFANTISDVPKEYGLLVIYKIHEGRFRITYNPSTSTAISKNQMWIGQLKGSDGSGLTWKRICTTSVDDFYNSKPTFTSESNYKISDVNNAYIECKNGWVFVSLPYVDVVSPTSNTTTLIKGLPKPRKGFWGETPSHVGTGNEALQYGIDVGGAFQLAKGSTGASYRVVFSYPASES